ncbi:MAG: hypothetical protein JXA96_10605 [Sedimentisphaerales bacterium]|nr:hypothetical protein [Sedimentisphaerales bacterium]
MHPWLETICVLILADIGVALGLLTTKYKKRIWLVCYLPPLILIILIALTRHFYRLVFYPPFSWLTEGRMEYVIFSITIPMIFSTLIPRLSLFRQKVILTIFVTIASVVFFVIPFISPILIRAELEKIETEFSEHGICLQTTNYTCGPAAAATALYQIGIEANEGELAIQAYTTPQTGTSDDLLKEAIEKMYSSDGVVCTYRCFDSIYELKGNCPVIVVTKFSFLIDHYITVLKVKDDEVIIGNPATGKEILSFEEFKKKWRSVGIVVKKQ